MAMRQYDLGAMRNVSSQLESYIEQWNAAVTNLYNIYQELDSMWDGSANDKENANFLQNDRDKYQNLSNVLQENLNVLNQAIQEYSTAEQQVSDLF